MATQNPFITVSPQQWMARTKVSGIAFRSGTLKKIDQLYNQAHINYLNEYVLNHPKKDFRNTLALLMTEFNRYLEEHNATSSWTGAGGKDLHRNQLSGGLMKQVYDFIEEFLGSQKTVPQHDARHARAGVLFLLGHTRPSVNMWSVASAAVSLGTASAAPVWKNLDVGQLTIEDPAAKLNLGLTTVARFKEQSGAVVDPRGFARNPRVGLYERVLETVKGLADGVLKFFQVRGETFYSILGKLIRIATDYVVGILTKAAPIVGAALDIVQGFIKACTAAVNYLATRRERSHFLFVSGHPALLAQNIEQEMKYDISAGVMQICKGAVSAAFGAFTASVGSLIIEAISAVVNFFRRFVEMKKIEAFCDKAKVELSKLKMGGYNLQNAEANKGQTFSKLIDDADEFGAFYQKGVSASVSIPILTLNSGICGDLMQMIRMYDSKSDVISQESVDAATRYFQRLKLWGCQHIQKNGIRFSSSYQNVQNLLHHAVYGHQGTQTTLQQVTTLAAG